MSAGPRPVTVRVCLGRVTPGGPIGPCSSATGAVVDGLRSRFAVVVAMFARKGSRIHKALVEDLNKGDNG